MTSKITKLRPRSRSAAAVATLDSTLGNPKSHFRCTKHFDRFSRFYRFAIGPHRIYTQCIRCGCGLLLQTD